MNLDYTVSGIYRINIMEYMDDILTLFDKMDPINSGTKSSASPENLFKAENDCENLSQEKAKGFHNLVAKTLYTNKKAIPDTCK